MRKFTIKIDRDSIRENPNAGRTKFQIPSGPSEIYIYTGKALNIPELRLISYDDDGYTYCCKNLNDELLELIKQKVDIFSIEKYNNLQTIYTSWPDSKFLYGYVTTEVECENCSSKFLHTELESDSYDIDLWSDEICPKCGCWNCCELEYEEI